MVELRPERCPISGLVDARRIFVYESPPALETRFSRIEQEPYYREVWQFDRSNHFVSCHGMNVAAGYTGNYVDATYANLAGIEATFARIVALPSEKSDNLGRIRRIQAFANQVFESARPVSLLDVGAGLGVFPYAAKQVGWNITAIDPDPRAVRHIGEKVGVAAICGDFMSVRDIGRFDIITFNKVLEHVVDPVRMLAYAHEFLADGGFVYVEVPDGEIAALEGKEREEFTIDHPHVFSFASVAMLANRAGFTPIIAERLREPSTKLTLRMFCVPAINSRKIAAI